MYQFKTMKVLEPANWLTLIRLPMAALLWIAPHDPKWLLSMLLAAGLSDVLDGRVAKALRAKRIEDGEDTETVGKSRAVGAWLDPLCDKTFVMSTLAALYVGFQAPLWMLVAIATREILLVPCALAYRLSPHLREIFRIDFRAGTFGKLATVAQFSAVIWLVMDADYLLPAVLVTSMVGFIATLVYLRRALRMARLMATNAFIYTQWCEVQGLPLPLSSHTSHRPGR